LNTCELLMVETPGLGRTLENVLQQVTARSELHKKKNSSSLGVCTTLQRMAIFDINNDGQNHEFHVNRPLLST